MTGLKNVKSYKRLAWIAVLSGAMVSTFSLSAFAQQDVDPTWFDPWAPNTSATHSAQQAKVETQPAASKSVAAKKSAPAVKRVAKATTKRPVDRPRPS
jgi:hypothetical protein